MRIKVINPNTTESMTATIGTCARPAGRDRFRVELAAERLDWLPGVLAAIDRPFVIDRPAELRGLVLALAGRLTASAGAAPPTRPRSAGSPSHRGSPAA